MATSFYLRFPVSSAVIAGSLNVNIHDASGNAINNGQQAMANSVPVAIASDQSAVPVSAASLPLPSGAATASNQTSGAQKAQITNSSGTAVTIKDLSVQVASGDLGLVTNTVIHGLNSAGGGSYVDVKVNPSGAVQTAIGDISGVVGQQAMAASLPVAIASNQSAIPASQSGTWTVQPGNTANTTPWLATINQGGNSAAVTASNALKVDGSAVTQPVSIAATIVTREAANTNGSIVNTSLSATTASSASAPANAVGFILEAPSDNTHNIRWCIGGTASATVGMLAEPGRDSGFVPCAATISVCAVTSGTNAFSIQWVLSS